MNWGRLLSGAVMFAWGVVRTREIADVQSLDAGALTAVGLALIVLGMTDRSRRG